MNIFFNYFIKILWVSIFFLIVFLDRENNIMVIITISILFLATIITVLRAFISRNEWRKLIEDGDVEIKEKIKF